MVDGGRVAREFRKVGVVGLGTMGAGIAEVLARNGIAVVGIEPTENALERGRGHVDHSTGRAVARGKLSPEDQAALVERIEFTTELERCADCDLVIEAIPERLDLKADLFARLDKICPPETILATNTSALSITEIAVATHRPSRVIGMHFFNPAPVMKLVEVIRSVVTDQEVVDDVEALVARLGKVDVTAGDRAGFIANALLFGYLNNAVRMLESRYATAEDIDAAMRFGCGHPMGPLALLDLIGLDSAYEILDTMYHQTRDHLHAPAPIIKQLVTAGYLGRKTGRGFYNYEEPDSPTVLPSAAREEPAEPSRRIGRVGVVGTGTMATGIVEVAAKAGFDVVYRARSADKVAAVRKALEKSLEKAVQRGKLDEADRAAALGRITGTVALDDLADCDIVIEAVVEDLDVKRALFAALDEVVKPGAILASTTSSLPVIECAAATSRPDDVIGLHFFNPAPVMKLVEIVPTIRTSADTVAVARALTTALGKHPVVCGDRAGFIVNALLFPYLNDAVQMLEEHYSNVEDIDYAMKLGCGHPMGPFELLDVVGLDVALAIQQTLYLEFREPGFAPAPLLEHLVTAGYLGRKSGRGFRDYHER
ncbi:MAG TPA: 3-hydroxybutyryl-CoA dehydrogenase [Frankiaceae bacterium]|nr:3-hydroxybutyryl-CoA dehydrogenase [Frankiaceae bacterium]